MDQASRLIGAFFVQLFMCSQGITGAGFPRLVLWNSSPGVKRRFQSLSYFKYMVLSAVVGVS